MSTGHAHLITRCECGIVMSQCRCAASRKTERIIKPCTHKKEPEHEVMQTVQQALAEPLTALFKTSPCRCVKNHTPACNRTHIHHIWPLGMGGPDTAENRIPLCPTTHSEVHLVLEAFQRAGKRLDRRREWGMYAYLMAVRGWEAKEAGQG